MLRFLAGLFFRLGQALKLPLDALNVGMKLVVGFTIFLNLLIVEVQLLLRKGNPFLINLYRLQFWMSYLQIF